MFNGYSSYVLGKFMGREMDEGFILIKEEWEEVRESFLE